jgi:hypothetical protein
LRTTLLLVWAVLALGLLVTILTGFYKVHSGYGLPISWWKKLESGNPTLWFSWENFVFDAAAWSMIFGLMALIIKRSRR